jgi:hypothetical protein
MRGKLPVLTTIAVLAFAVTGVQAQSSRGWGTAAIELLVSGPETNGGNLQKVRVAKHRGYDRVVFEFDGKTLPKSTVRFARPPFHLGESDSVVKVNGNAFIEAVFTSARAHDLETGRITVTETLARLSSVRETKRIYDHEGQVIYILGLPARKQFRVLTLMNPVRLVVDIKH